MTKRSLTNSERVALHTLQVLRAMHLAPSAIYNFMEAGKIDTVKQHIPSHYLYSDRWKVSSSKEFTFIWGNPRQEGPSGWSQVKIFLGKEAEQYGSQEPVSQEADDVGLGWWRATRIEITGKPANKSHDKPGSIVISDRIAIEMINKNIEETCNKPDLFYSIYG